MTQPHSRTHQPQYDILLRRTAGVDQALCGSSWKECVTLIEKRLEWPMNCYWPSLAFKLVHDLYLPLRAQSPGVRRDHVGLEIALLVSSFDGGCTPK